MPVFWRWFTRAALILNVLTMLACAWRAHNFDQWLQVVANFLCGISLLSLLVSDAYARRYGSASAPEGK